MKGEGARLNKHCKLYHEDEDKGFLKYGEIPPKPIYLNFDEYLKGSAESLVFDPQVKTNKSGRPKDLHKIDKII